jgi:hypothetical protein
LDEPWQEVHDFGRTAEPVECSSREWWHSTRIFCGARDSMPEP